jgi:hypothetical protein
MQGGGLRGWHSVFGDRQHAGHIEILAVEIHRLLRVAATIGHMVDTLDEHCVYTSFGRAVSDDAAPFLVFLDAAEQRTEVALAEALVVNALNDLDKDWADEILREDLQQVTLGITVNQNLVPLQAPTDSNAAATSSRKRR